MTAKTLAERSALFRKRRAEKLARYETALQSIANNMTLEQVLAEYGDGDFEGAYDAFVSIARNALNGDTSHD